MSRRCMLFPAKQSTSTSEVNLPQRRLSHCLSTNVSRDARMQFDNVMLTSRSLGARAGASPAPTLLRSGLPPPWLVPLYLYIHKQKGDPNLWQSSIIRQTSS